MHLGIGCPLLLSRSTILASNAEGCRFLTGSKRIKGFGRGSTACRERLPPGLVTNRYCFLFVANVGVASTKALKVAGDPTRLREPQMLSPSAGALSFGRNYADVPANLQHCKFNLV
jgi:hypothetical protein